MITEKQQVARQRNWVKHQLNCLESMLKILIIGTPQVSEKIGDELSCAKVFISRANEAFEQEKIERERIK